MTASTATGLVSPLTTTKYGIGDRLSKKDDGLKKYHHASGSGSGSGEHSKSSQQRQSLPCHRRADPSIPTTPQVDSISQARERVKRSFDKSKLLENDEYVFPRFDIDELTLGEELGRGGFGTVLEITSIVPTGEEKRNEVNGSIAEKGMAFSIDDRKSLRFFLHRRRDHDCQECDENERTLPFTNSHDGWEGPVLSGLTGISEKETIRSTKSHDCVGGNACNTESPVNMSNNPQNSRRSKHRTRALSWSSAKTRAHARANNVSHFFHRIHRNSHDEENSVKEGWLDETSRGMGALQKDELKDLADFSPTDEGSPNAKPIGDRHTHGRRRASDQPLHKRRLSRNFSFQAWRDSEAGDEGSDAISPEELKKYKVDSSFFGSFCFHGSPARNNLDAISNLRVQDGNGEEKLESEVLPIKSSASGVRDELIADTRTEGCRRLVMYSNPKEVALAELKEIEDAEPTNNAYYQGYQDKTFITHNATTSRGEARYVIKIISPHIVENDFKEFLQAAMDMAMETYFLSALSHPHIIKMRGVGQGDMFSPNYFLVLDRLYDTLCCRIEGTWRRQQVNLDNSILIWNRSRKSHTLWRERIRVMKDLSSALGYLHQMKIIYRDLKPENVGFDGMDNVKLFDFGLAKEVHEQDECANGTFKITPNTGSIRYMAPENGNKWPYNFMVDTYSFAICLWEVLSLERPFECYTPREIRDMVMKWGERPKITRVGWSPNVVNLMKQAWDSNFRKRPTMKAVEEALKRELNSDSM